MTIKELGEKYGFNQRVHVVVLDKDINQILAMDGIVPGHPKYAAQKARADEGFERLFDIFIDSLERVMFFVKQDLPIEQRRRYLRKKGFLRQRKVCLVIEEFGN